MKGLQIVCLESIQIDSEPNRTLAAFAADADPKYDGIAGGRRNFPVKFDCDRAKRTENAFGGMLGLKFGTPASRYQEFFSIHGEVLSVSILERRRPLVEGERRVFIALGAVDRRP